MLCKIREVIILYKNVKRGSDNEHILCKNKNTDDDSSKVTLKDVHKMYLVDGWIYKE